MNAYIKSLKMLKTRGENKYYPTHGAPIENPMSFIRGLILHRKMREGQIINLLKKGDTTIPNMVNSIYKELDKRLIPAAQRSVFAHIIDLSERGKISCVGNLAIDNIYALK